MQRTCQKSSVGVTGAGAGLARLVRYAYIYIYISRVALGQSTQREDSNCSKAPEPALCATNTQEILPTLALAGGSQSGRKSLIPLPLCVSVTTRSGRPPLVLLVRNNQEANTPNNLTAVVLEKKRSINAWLHASRLVMGTRVPALRHALCGSLGEDCRDGFGRCVRGNAARFLLETLPNRLPKRSLFAMLEPRHAVDTSPRFAARAHPRGGGRSRPPRFVNHQARDGNVRGG